MQSVKIQVKRKNNRNISTDRCDCTWPIILGVGSSSSTNSCFQIQPRLTLDPCWVLVIWLLFSSSLDSLGSVHTKPDMQDITITKGRTKQPAIVPLFPVIFPNHLQSIYVLVEYWKDWLWIHDRTVLRSGTDQINLLLRKKRKIV